MAAVRSLLLLLTLSTLALGAPHKADKSPKPKKPGISDLADTVDRSVILTKFAALMQASDLGTFLSSRGPFTFFVPTNSAFSRLPPGMFEDLLRPANKEQLQRIVLFNLVNGKAWDEKDLKTVKSLPSCEGSPLPLRTNRTGAQFVVKARIVRADVKCSNGLLHQVDTLLMPPHLLLVASVGGDDAANATPADGGATNGATASNTPPTESSPTVGGQPAAGSTSTNDAPAAESPSPNSAPTSPVAPSMR